jgi:hypothetical protein
MRFGLAVAIAVVSDLASTSTEFMPPLQVGIDLATAGLLYLALGRSWFLLTGLVAEAIPGVALFPSWILVVSAVGAWGGLRRPASPPTTE